MRIWDIPLINLCDKHLVAEHGELHAIWSIITNNKKGFANHPEVSRWRGKLKALYRVHENLVSEMTYRGFNHNSSLSISKAVGKGSQDVYLSNIDEQIKILKAKDCKCIV